MGKEELEIASKMVKPIYAAAMFNVSRSGITYTLTFDYIDPMGYYREILGNEDLKREEIERLASNMQEYLDEEETTINGLPVRPEVIFTDIGFRGDLNRPFIVFLILIDAEVRRGVNVYENRYEPDIFEYDYSAYWVFPRSSRIIEVIIGGEVTIIDSIIIIRGSRGDTAPGYERIKFEIK
ncbi:MAG TPA: hypothetical protein VNL13_06105 [Sulfolobales archaeon]|nr:hypothetical protein [Sulfolobales archaeon]